MNDVRHAVGYEPRFDIDAAVGRQGELLIGSAIEALRNGASVEIKVDEVSLQTGRFYVELLCLRRGRWRRSGLADTCAELFAITLGSTGLALIGPTALLRQIVEPMWNAGRRVEQTRGSHPTKGVAVPINRLIVEARRFRTSD